MDEVMVLGDSLNDYSMLSMDFGACVAMENAVEALKDNNIELFGKLMNASHESLKNDYEVSCEEIDILVDLAQAMPGVIGSRITGGGFGGCTVSIIKNDTVDTFVNEIGKAYEEKVGHKAEFYIVDIGDGAHKLN